MKKIAIFALLIAALASPTQAQEIVPITSFENLDETWAYSGGNVQFSFVEVELPNGVQPTDGEAALVVNYDNMGSTWQFTTMNFPIDPVDLTGMREIRMDVYFTPESTGDLSLRLDLADGNILGFAYPPTAGEWHTVSFPIDRKLSVSEFIKTINWVGGFFAPETGDNAGELFIDNIRAVRPEGVVDVEEVVVFGFNEEDEDGTPAGWNQNESEVPTLGLPEDLELIDPKEGDNFMVMFASGGFAWNVVSDNLVPLLNRASGIQEVLFDVFVPESMTNGWIQTRIALQSQTGEDEETGVWTETKELGYSDATGGWRELLYAVDISSHVDNINAPEGWLTVHISTNNGADDAGKMVFVDNFRVAVPISSDVSDWSLF